LASFPRLTAMQGVGRDAVIFLTAAYPTRSEDERRVFERAALEPDLFAEDREKRWWRSMLARLLSGVPADLLVTDGMRALRDELDAAGDLQGNRPFMTITTGWGSSENIVDSLLRDDGVNLEKSPDREVRAASRVVEDQLKVGENSQDAPALAKLWADIASLVAELDTAGDAIHSNLAHSSWGAVSNGVEALCKSKSYLPDIEGMPSLDSVLGLIDRLAQSQYPERDDDTSDSMSWGNWDVRVYAASSTVALAPRFADTRPDIVDRMATYLKDPAPNVRLQVAQALNTLWDVARPRMWDLVEDVAATETFQGVLHFFVAGPVWMIAPAEPARCDTIMDGLLKREWARSRDNRKTGRSRDVEPFANLAALLHVVFGQPKCGVWIQTWASDLVRGGEYITVMLNFLRVVFFYPFHSDTPDDQAETGRRGRAVLDLVTDAAETALIDARPHLIGSPDADAVEAWQPLFIAADQVVDSVCDQIFYGSGAFRHRSDEEGAGLATPEAKRQFLTDFAPILDVIGAQAHARTIHNLMQVLTYLEEADPARVFDRAAGVLLGPASKGGYQYESLAVGELVKLIRRYLADHREVFDEPVRRQELVKVLELFSNVGWPDALKLLFELPDLLR
jgi:hypothetical protein